MFDSLFDDMMAGIGQKLEHEGREYLRVGRKFWINEANKVVVELVIPCDSLVGSLCDLKALISIEPKPNELTFIDPKKFEGGIKAI